jgi:biopolymer transport protein ExbD
MRLSILLALVLSVTMLAAQSPTAKTRKSLAEGLVRHCIERDGIKPPHLESGLEIGTGKGDLVLLVRRQDGTLRLEATPRGLGDHGPAAGIPEVPEVIEEAFVAANGKPPIAKPVRKAAPAKLSIKRYEGKLTIATLSDENPLAVESLDRTRLQASLKKLFATTSATSAQAQLHMQVDVDASMQVVMTCWEVARLAGFTTVMFSVLGRLRPSTDDELGLIQGLPGQFGWVAKKQQQGPAIYDGELLILLDGPTRFGDVVPLFAECARKGIWQIAFAGQKDKHHRFKLPMHVPVDR